MWPASFLNQVLQNYTCGGKLENNTLNRLAYYSMPESGLAAGPKWHPSTPQNLKKQNGGQSGGFFCTTNKNTTRRLFKSTKLAVSFHVCAIIQYFVANDCFMKSFCCCSYVMPLIQTVLIYDNKSSSEKKENRYLSQLFGIPESK